MQSTLTTHAAPPLAPNPLLRCLRDVFRRFLSAYELRRYTPETIAEYHRRAGAQIGDHCYIIPTSLGTEPYLVRIGNHVAIAAGVSFITHDGAAWVFRHETPDLQVYGPIVIHDNCFIGAHAILCPNIHIGPNSVVAAGSLVISDVPPDTIVAGVPARPWGSMGRYREKCVERWACQRPPGVVVEPGETWWHSRHFASNRELLKRHLMTLFHDDVAEPGKRTS
jgi:acetyltransferase-like isoleucine patch superfamily enzyme